MTLMRGLFLRVFLWFWLGSTCLVLVFVVGLIIARPDVVATWRFIGRTAMRSLGSQIANTYEARGTDAAASALAEVRREGRFGVWLYSGDGHLVAGPSSLADATRIVRTAMGSDAAEPAASNDASLLARRTVSDSGTPYVVIWEAPLWLRSQVSPSRLVLRIFALVLTGGVVCALLTWQITKPIRMLRHAARRFADGDLSVRVGSGPELRRVDELAELGRDFDHMAGRIQELVTSQQQLLADISHELRSPLARLSLALDLARRRFGDEVPEHQRMDREIQRLNELIEQLLTLARLRGQSEQPQLEPVHLRELLREVAQDARFEADGSGRAVVIERECDAILRGSRTLLRSAIENVVRNAIRHTPERTTVAIAMEPMTETGRVAISVRDHGAGVPPDAVERLFDPFFRVDEARDRSSGGIGLGLAITRQAAQAHGGKATARNHPDGGLEVRIELPVAAAVRGDDFSAPA